MGTKTSTKEQEELLTVEAGVAVSLAPARRRGRGDEGFSLIEIMAGMAIIAILAMAVLPQFGKYFERAAIQNLSAEINNAALLVESDHSLTGATKYIEGPVTKAGTVMYSVAGTERGKETKLAGAVPAASNALGFTVTGTNDAVKNYTLVYYGGNNGTQASGLVIKPGAPTAITDQKR